VEKEPLPQKVLAFTIKIVVAYRDGLALHLHPVVLNLKYVKYNTFLLECLMCVCVRVCVRERYICDVMETARYTTSSFKGFVSYVWDFLKWLLHSRCDISTKCFSCLCKLGIAL
jgi:hypothetical protein